MADTSTFVFNQWLLCHEQGAVHVEVVAEADVGNQGALKPAAAAAADRTTCCKAEAAS
jgi:hypothetical protein